MSEKLKQCPFCGGEAEVIPPSRDRHGYSVMCKERGAHHPTVHAWAMTEAKAIAAWNTRHERECEILRNHRGEPYCTRCFAALGEQMIDAGGREWASPSYCPNRGAYVTSKEARQ